MPISFIFWLLMLFVLVFRGWRYWRAPSGEPFGDVLLFVIIALLGWRVFGFPIQG